MTESTVFLVLLITGTVIISKQCFSCLVLFRIFFSSVSMKESFVFPLRYELYQNFKGKKEKPWIFSIYTGTYFFSFILFQLQAGLKQMSCNVFWHTFQFSLLFFVFFLFSFFPPLFLSLLVCSLPIFIFIVLLFLNWKRCFLKFNFKTEKKTELG